MPSTSGSGSYCEIIENEHKSRQVQGGGDVTHLLLRISGLSCPKDSTSCSFDNILLHQCFLLTGNLGFKLFACPPIEPTEGALKHIPGVLFQVVTTKRFLL